MRPSPLDLDVVSDYMVEQLARMSDRGLGAVQLQSNLAASTQSLTTAKAARNLLTKARRDLAAGQLERAAAYIDRALHLPYNDTAEAPTAAYEAHMSLFTIVSDAVEAGDEDDPAWLDAAEAALPRCGEHAREELLQTLRTINHEYELAPSQRRRIRSIAPGDPQSDVGDVGGDRAGYDDDVQRTLITELLVATTVYEDELRRRLAAG
jgi:hypothetical protein